MITFRKFFIYLKQNNISQYSLIKNKIATPALLDALRKSMSTDCAYTEKKCIRTDTLLRLCEYLDCRPQDIMEQEAEGLSCKRQLCREDRQEQQEDGCAAGIKSLQ